MKALSVQQPWAELIASGAKTMEVRSRRTHYRGPLVICASLGLSKRPGVELFDCNGPRGVTVALVELVDCIEGEAVHSDAAKLDPTGYYCWVLRCVRRLPPLQVKGQLGVFTLPEVVARRLRAA